MQEDFGSRGQRAGFSAGIGRKRDNRAFLVTFRYALDYPGIPIKRVEIDGDDRGLRLAGDFSSARGIIGSGDRVARFGEILLSQIKRSWIGIDHQRGALGIGQRDFSVTRRRHAAFDFERQRHSEDRTLTLAARHSYLAAKHFHQSPGDRKPETGPGPRASSRVRDLPKLFEDSCDVGFGDADTGVAHGYANAIRPGTLGGNLYFPFPRELNRVREQVDKNLLKLRSIGAHRRQPVFGIETELDGASFLERFDDRQSALDQVACVRRL